MRKLPWIGFAILLAGFWFAAPYLGAEQRFGGHVPATFLSFALLLAPYWGFGFGIAKALPRNAALPLILIGAYLIYVIPRGTFEWPVCAGLAGAILTITLLCSLRRGLADGLAMLIIALCVELHFFDKHWPLFPKLLFVDTALYGFLVMRQLEGIGFDLSARVGDFRIGLREFAFFTPIAMAVGFALQFLHLHAVPPNPGKIASAWIFTLFFIAIPEEIFFRGLMLNLLETLIGTRNALIATAAIFGLAHFNKRADVFNWRYVILAAIAGIFYGRAWLADRRVLTSSVTHAIVDTVWSIWLR